MDFRTAASGYLVATSSDAGLSAFGIHIGLVREANPLLASLDPWAIVLVKITASLAIISIMAAAYNRGPRLITAALRAGTALNGAIASWVLIVLIHELSWLEWGTKWLG